MMVIKVLSASSFFRFTCFIFWLVTCPALLGQANQKRMLTPADYKLWSKLYADQISNDGRWASYCLHYQYDKSDTLFVQQTAGGEKYSFAHSEQGKFNAELHFACMAKNTLYLQNLKTGTTETILNVVAYDFSANHKFISIWIKNSNQTFDLEIRNLEKGTVHQIKGLTGYSFDPDQNGVVYTTSENNASRIEIILFKNEIEKRSIIKNRKDPFKKLLWKAAGISFMSRNETDSEFFFYSVSKNKLHTLDSKSTAFPQGMQFTDSPLRTNIHSKDGTKVIVWLKENPDSLKVINPETVQIWNTKDKLLYDSRKYFGDPKMSEKMAVWNLQDNTVLQFTDREFSSGFLSADYNYAFLSNPTGYEPQSKQITPYDLYLVDLKSGKRKLLILNYPFDEKPAGSPDGNYLCYAIEGQWWIYDIKNETHTCLTKGIPNSFFSEDTNRPTRDKPYGIGGWTKNREIILYDRYDLWKISLDGKTKKKLTSGREIQKTFRIKVFNSDPFYSRTESNKHSLDLKKGFLLETLDNESPASGLSYWDLKSGVKELVWENKKISLIKKSPVKDIYLYQIENFESSPALMLYDRQPKQIMQSNPQQDNFYWSRNEKIEFVVDGIKTKGILFYPANFDTAKKYPMVVHIYERQFTYINDYENPSEISDTGFNVHHYTANGYFVLFPDINYEFGNLRKSVTNSVLAAVDAVIAKGNINPSKIGLIGHSFGGYETDLIITQTDRFAAAVAGSAITDLLSSYLYVGPTFRRPDFFRTEDHQLRIGKSLYEDMQSYLDNSPVLLASNVKTPLLGWAGAEDRHVNSQQSMEFYLALRRLNKEHVLLLYPGEEHGLEQKENALDLNIRVMQWFNFYLKDDKQKEWFGKHYK